MTEMRWY